MSATISVAMSGSHGWVMAVIPSEDRYVMGAALVVGSVRQVPSYSSPGARPEVTAWLFPFPGGAIRLGTHCEALTAPDAKTLEGKLQKRARQRPWWSVPDGRCPEVLEHAGRKSRCKTSSVVAHDVHRHWGDGVEWMTEEDFMNEDSGEGSA